MRRNIAGAIVAMFVGCGTSVPAWCEQDLEMAAVEAGRDFDLTKEDAATAGDSAPAVRGSAEHPALGDKIRRLSFNSNQGRPGPVPEVRPHHPPAPGENIFSKVGKGAVASVGAAMGGVLGFAGGTLFTAVAAALGPLSLGLFWQAVYNHGGVDALVGLSVAPVTGAVKGARMGWEKVMGAFGSPGRPS